MPNPQILIPFIKSWEGAYVNHPLDKGGPTNMGITLRVYRAVYGSKATIADLKALSEQEWQHIFLSLYWNAVKAPHIQSQAIANLLVDYAWGSGVNTAIRALQKILSTKADGIMGTKTISALNSRKPQLVFELLHKARTQKFLSIVKKSPAQEVFLAGWLRRNNAIGYNKLMCNGGKEITWTY